METYSYSFDSEIFHGSYASRDEATKAALAQLDPSDSETKFWTGRNDDPPHASTFIKDADDLIDDMAQRAYDEFAEAADSWPSSYTPDQTAEIQRRLDDIAGYVQSIDPPKFYLIVDVEAHVATEA